MIGSYQWKAFYPRFVLLVLLGLRILLLHLLPPQTRSPDVSCCFSSRVPGLLGALVWLVLHRWLSFLLFAPLHPHYDWRSCRRRNSCTADGCEPQRRLPKVGRLASLIWNWSLGIDAFCTGQRLEPCALSTSPQLCLVLTFTFPALIKVGSAPAQLFNSQRARVSKLGSFGFVDSWTTPLSLPYSLSSIPRFWPSDRVRSSFCSWYE